MSNPEIMSSSPERSPEQISEQMKEDLGLLTRGMQVELEELAKKEGPEALSAAVQLELNSIAAELVDDMAELVKEKDKPAIAARVKRYMNDCEQVFVQSGLAENEYAKQLGSLRAFSKGTEGFLDAYVNRPSTKAELGAAVLYCVPGAGSAVMYGESIRGKTILGEDLTVGGRIGNACAATGWLVVDGVALAAGMVSAGTGTVAIEGAATAAKAGRVAKVSKVAATGGKAVRIGKVAAKNSVKFTEVMKSVGTAYVGRKVRGAKVLFKGVEVMGKGKKAAKGVSTGLNAEKVFKGVTKFRAEKLVAAPVDTVIEKGLDRLEDNRNLAEVLESKRAFEEGFDRDYRDAA